MEEQLEGLAEMISYSKEEEETMLKELYDDIAKQDAERAYEYDELKNEISQIHSLLDSYGVPKTDNKIKLSAIERLEIALKNMRLYA